MDLKKFLQVHGLENYSAGLCGCRAHGNPFESCDYDVVVFDGTDQDSQILEHDGRFVNLHHCSIDGSSTHSLIHMDGMTILSDDSWELRPLLSRFLENRYNLFVDHAKNCLIDSLFCCQQCALGLEKSDVFSSCWQKCASFLLIDAVFALNHIPPSPSHMLEITRRFEKNPINEKMSSILQTLGLERATPSLLKRMLKSTVGFLQLTHDSTRARVVKDTYDYLVRHSMFSDCYFYLGYVNKMNFLKMGTLAQHDANLIHILKISFDLEVYSTTIMQHSQQIQNMCSEIMHSLSK